MEERLLQVLRGAHNFSVAAAAYGMTSISDACPASSAAPICHIRYISSASAHPRTTQHRKTLAREKVSIRDACAVVVQWSICLLTFVDDIMMISAERLQFTYLFVSQQTVHVSAPCTLHAIRTACVHVAVRCLP